jgi:peptidoglycan/LPS O-acetylase OafA/YrhL
VTAAGQDAAPQPPSPLGHVDALTGVRALAALWVLAHHLNAIVGPRIVELGIAGLAIDVTPLLTCGWVGVDIFFVLSGFLLTRQLLEVYESDERRGANRRFLLHRVLRVYPAYLVQLAILLAVAWLAAGTVPAWVRHLPLHLAMLQAVTPQSESAINSVYWTLTAEFWFYVLLPFVVAGLHAAARRGEAALGRRALGLYAAAVAITIACRAAIQAAHGAGYAFPLEWAARQLPATLDVFAAGMLAAVACRLSGRVPAAASGVLVAGGLAGIVAMLYVMHHHYLAYWAGGPLFYLWHAITAACAALMVLGASRNGRLARALFATRPALYLGNVSYSLYLWHFPVALWVAALVPPARGELTYAAAAAAAAVAASALSYRLVERPVLSRRDRIERALAGGLPAR